MACSFRKIAGKCGANPKASGQVGTCVLLSECDKDVTCHLKSMKVSEPNASEEVDLILSRAGVYDFKGTRTLKRNLIICPSHRGSLGINWRRNSAKCSVPRELSKHTPRKGDRGLNWHQVRIIYMKCGIHIPVGSGSCFLIFNVSFCCCY